MDTAVVSALSAVLGSIVGGSATIATAWVTQRTQSRRSRLRAEISKREALYARFIAECSKLAIDALDHHLDNPGKMFQVYALENRIRLTSSDAVVAAAAETIARIIKQYYITNLAPEQLRAFTLSVMENPAERPDPLRPFSEACRAELVELYRAG
jgi:hypothetical protein